MAKADLGCSLHVHVICTSIYFLKCPSQAFDATGFKLGGAPATVAGNVPLWLTGAERCKMRVQERGGGGTSYTWDLPSV